MTRLVVVGAGGFGRETLDVIDSINRVDDRLELVGVIDDDPTETNLRRLHDRDVPYAGRVDAWLRDAAADINYVIAVGRPELRSALASRFDGAGCRAATLVHPAAAIGSAHNIGAGVVVCSGVQISTNVTLGRHVHVNPNATIGHDAVLHDFVSVNPAAVISGECVVHRGVLIGAGAIVLQGLAVGESSVVGAAACVLTSVPSGCTVKGVPAR